MAFNQYPLHEDILKVLEEIGFTEPTSVQAQTIEPALAGKDILGIAQTGTGKTGAFLLPLLTMMAQGRARARMPRCVILEPTRELAQQVEEEFKKFAKYLNMNSVLLIGGVSSKPQEQMIAKGVDILIATPGRFLDQYERGKLLLNDIKYLVVDEADRMLDMGFIPDVEKICSLTPFTRQTLLFSATMPAAIGNIAENFMSAPVRVEVARQSSVSENVTQYLIPTSEKRKRELLRGLFKKEKPESAIVFCNSKRGVNVLTESLQKHGFSASALHGDIPQNIRTKVLDAFRNRNISIMVASDVAARGIDIPHVDCVVNFDIPSHAEDYVHRIGRTGRGGNKGTSYSFFAEAGEKDCKYLTAVEDLIQTSIPRLNASDYISAEESEEARQSSREEHGERKERGERSDRPNRENSFTKAPRQPEKRERSDNRNENRNDNRNDNRNESRGDNRNDNRGDKRTYDKPKRSYSSGSGDSVESLRNDPQKISDMDEIPSFLLRSVAPYLTAE